MSYSDVVAAEARRIILVVLDACAGRSNDQVLQEVLPQYGVKLGRDALHGVLQSMEEAGEVAVERVMTIRVVSRTGKPAFGSPADVTIALLEARLAHLESVVGAES